MDRGARSEDELDEAGAATAQLDCNPINGLTGDVKVFFWQLYTLNKFYQKKFLIAAAC
jgi:hypothetical protein